MFVLLTMIIKVLTFKSVTLNSIRINTMTLFQPALIACALAVSFASIDVNAHDVCDVDLTAGLTINAKAIEFLKAKDSENEDSHSLYKITQGKYLFVDNKNIELNNAQQTLVSEYDAKIRQLVPQVKSVAIEGVDLAIQGVELAFNGLLGEGNQVTADLTQELDVIREQVSAKLSIANGITVDVDGLESEELLGKDFDQRIEKLVEKTLLNSMGSILMVMGQQMIASDDSEQSFEDRMDSFGDTIEQEMSLRAEKIEAKAQVLCANIAKVDSLEEQLKNNIKELANTNIFTVTHDQNDEEKHALSM